MKPRINNGYLYVHLSNINANYTQLTANVSNLAGQVTFTTTNKGVSAGQVNVNVAWFGPSNNEFVPAGISYTVNTIIPGTVDPDPTTALANLGSDNYDFIIFPYTTTTALTPLKNFQKVQSTQSGLSAAVKKKQSALTSANGDLPTTASSGWSSTPAKKKSKERRSSTAQHTVTWKHGKRTEGK